MKKLLFVMPCILSLVSIAQMHIPLGRVGGIWDQYGRFNIMNEAPDSDSSHAAITTGQAKRLFSGGGGGGTPGGSGGDIQMNGSPGFAASKLNQASNVITYTGDVDFIYKSATDPNALHGLSFHNSSGTEVAFMKPNIATGEFKIGGNASYTTSIYSGGSLVAVFNGSGLNLGGFINHGEQLAVQGQAYISSFVGLGAIPIITAGVALPASTTSSASFNITTGVPPTVGHTGDCYSDGTHGYIYMGGAWRQIDQQSGGSGVPGGADTQVQYDSSGAFSGSPFFTYNRSTHELTIAKLIVTVPPSGSSTDSALGWDAVTKKVTMRSGTVNLNVGNGMTLNVDTVDFGGSQNKTTIYDLNGFPLKFNNIKSATSGDALNAMVRKTDSSLAQIPLAFGGYTPSVSSTTNVASSSPLACTYTRIGDKVTVYGSVSITPTAGSTITFFDLSLPSGLTSTLSSGSDLNGVGNGYVSTSPVTAVIGANTSTNHAQISFQAASSTSPCPLLFTFQYTIH